MRYLYAVQSVVGKQFVSNFKLQSKPTHILGEVQLDEKEAYLMCKNYALAVCEFASNRSGIKFQLVRVRVPSRRPAKKGKRS